MSKWLRKADVEDGIKPGVTSSESAELRELRKATAAGRTRRALATQPQKRPMRRSKRPEITASAVREWARSTGHQVSDRGRVATDLVEAYRAAH